LDTILFIASTGLLETAGIGGVEAGDVELPVVNGRAEACGGLGSEAEETALGFICEGGKEDKRVAC
jgi:hypothetical protein